MTSASTPASGLDDATEARGDGATGRFHSGGQIMRRIDDEGEGKPPRDVRKNPCRGVRIKPLPKHMHDDFRAFCDALRMHAQSHLSTIKLAEKDDINDWVICQSVYWRSCLKYINTIEYLGTINAKSRRHPGSRQGHD